MDTPTPRRSRSRLQERAQRLYTARGEEYTVETQLQQGEGFADYVPNEESPAFDGYAPNEDQQGFAGFVPNEEDAFDGEYPANEEVDSYDGYTPNEETVYQLTDWQQDDLPPAPEFAPQVDYAAYYSREAAEQEVGPAFAPPPSMQQYTYAPVESAPEEETDENAYANNMYRPRAVTWAEEERSEVIAESELGYQVQAESGPVRKKRRVLPVVLIGLLVFALLAAAAWFQREQIAEWIGRSAQQGIATEEPMAATVTPEPVKAYEAAPAAAVAATARNAIAQLSGTLNMENHIVTDQHVVTRNQRADGTFDFYLFTAEGRLLCYFEGLGPGDMIPLENNTFYVRQSPWLIAPGGSGLIRTSDIEAALDESVFLHPMYHGWAVVESEADGSANYVDADGKVMSSLWFARTFPFTGEYTLAYVDTGSTADDRYLLYVIGRDGAMTRWLSKPDMQDVVAAICDMAYMSDGALYHLPDTETPICQSPQITAYLDCDAMVVRDPVSGKYGLFVHGEQHYDFVYDAIHPLESEIIWEEKTLGSEKAQLTLKAVSVASYPQPLSHSFVLEKAGQREYVALSSSTACPILLDGEF